MQSTPIDPKPNRSRLFLDLFLAGLGALLFIGPLAIFAYTGSFTRFMADEYNTLDILKQTGFWGSQIWWYLNWSGRFTFTFFVNVVELFETGLFPYVTGFLMVAWIAATGWALYQVFKILRARHPLWFSLVSACMVVYFSLVMLTNLHQVIYWVTGILTYVAPLVCLTILIGYLLRRYRLYPDLRPGWGPLSFVFLLAFLAGGFSETSLALQVIIFGLLLVGGWFFLPKKLRPAWMPLLLAGLLGSLLSLAVVGLAPGNFVRVSHTAEKKGLMWAIPATWGSVKYYILEAAGRKTFYSLVCLVIPGVIAFFFLDFETLSPIKLSLKGIAAAILLPLAACLLVSYAVFFPANYMLSDGPPERSVVVVLNVIAFAVLFWGLLGGWLLRRLVDQVLPGEIGQAIARVLIVAVLSVLGIQTALRCQDYLATAAEAKGYAQAWDRRDQILREAAKNGQDTVTVELLWRQGDLGDLSPYWDSAMNVAAASYYGVDKIIAGED